MREKKRKRGKGENTERHEATKGTMKFGQITDARRWHVL